MSIENLTAELQEGLDDEAWKCAWGIYHTTYEDKGLWFRTPEAFARETGRNLEEVLAKWNVDVERKGPCLNRGFLQVAAKGGGVVILAPEGRESLV